MKDDQVELFSRLISSMDIPVMRREINIPNLKWFLRNAQIRNGSNPNLKSAIELAKKLIK